MVADWAQLPRQIFYLEVPAFVLIGIIAAVIAACCSLPHKKASCDSVSTHSTGQIPTCDPIHAEADLCL